MSASGSAKFLCAMFFALIGPWAGAQPCELDRPVMFAGLDYDSARVHNAIARHIIETGYGCPTDALPGSVIPLLAGMARGDIDVNMEIWTNNVAEAWAKALEAGAVVQLSVNYPDAVQGWYVPRYVVEGDPARGIEPMAPDLKSVFDLPRYATLFQDPEEPDKGRFYNCILGWQCEVLNTRKLKVYGLDEAYTNFRPGTGEALAAAIASAYKRGKPIVAYYWGPTWVLGLYDMVMLEEPAFNQADWEKLQTQDDPQVAVAYPEVRVSVGVSKGFHDQAPRLVEFLDNYETSNRLVSELLAYMQEHDADEGRAARHFLETHPEVWTRWVPGEVAERVKASL